VSKSINILVLVFFIYSKGTFIIIRMATGSFKRLPGCVCIVTGATRGIGKGIALQLGEAGATVYITGKCCNNHMTV